MRFTANAASVVCALSLVCPQPLVRAQEPLPAPARAEQPTPMTRGRLTDLDARTPWPGQLIRIVAAATNGPVAAATTDAQGHFAVPALEPGVYLVVVGQVVARLEVAPERPVRSLHLVVAAEQLRGEQLLMADLQPVAAFTGTTLLLVGGAVVIVGGVAAGAAVGIHQAERGSDDRDAPPVSPSSP